MSKNSFPLCYMEQFSIGRADILGLAKIYSFFGNKVVKVGHHHREHNYLEYMVRVYEETEDAFYDHRVYAGCQTPKILDTKLVETETFSAEERLRRKFNEEKTKELEEAKENQRNAPKTSQNKTPKYYAVVCRSTEEGAERVGSFAGNDTREIARQIRDLVKEKGLKSKELGTVKLRRTIGGEIIGRITPGGQIRPY